jgi:hypothetical protein
MKVNQVLSRGGYQWEGGHKEQVKKGEYGRSIMYLCMKMEK